MPEPPQSDLQGERGQRSQEQPQARPQPQPQSQPEADGPQRLQAPPIWLPFGLFVLGFVILVVESKYNLPSTADYALKGLGGGLCLVTVVWIRRQARKAGVAKRRPAK